MFELQSPSIGNLEKLCDEWFLGSFHHTMIVFFQLSRSYIGIWLFASFGFQSTKQLNCFIRMCLESSKQDGLERRRSIILYHLNPRLWVQIEQDLGYKWDYHSNSEDHIFMLIVPDDHREVIRRSWENIASEEYGFIFYDSNYEMLQSDDELESDEIVSWIFWHWIRETSNFNLVKFWSRCDVMHWYYVVSDKLIEKKTRHQ